MLTYSLTQSKKPLYIQLYEYIKNDIENAVIIPGERLPSKRSLSEHLKISVITVESAYAQLISEGYINAVEKRGYFAAEIQRYRAENTAEVTVQKPPHEKKASKEYFANLADSSVLSAGFPFSVWSKQLRETLTEQSPRLLTKPPIFGIPELQKAISDFLRTFRGMTVSPDCIVIGAGTEYLYTMLIRLLNGKTIAVEDPGYKTVANIYKSSGAECRYIPTDNMGMRPDMLKSSDAEVVHLSPSHHFPTGAVMPINRRIQMLDWAYEKEGRYIIEDDYDSEFRFTGKPIPSLQSTDNLGRRVIYMNTFSKTISSSIRISYMILPPRLAEEYREKLGFFSCTVSAFEQSALEKFISKGYFERHINHMRKQYKLQRDFLISEIHSILKNRVTVQEQNAGLHFILKVDTDASDEALIKAAEENGIKIACLSQYCHCVTPECMHRIIVNYGGLSREKTTECVLRLKKAIDSL